MSYSVADGTQYFDDGGVEVIDDGTIIPGLADGSGCCAYLSDGSVAPLTHPGRAKYNLLPVNAPCVAFDGSGVISLGIIPKKEDGSEDIEFYYKHTTDVAWALFFSVGLADSQYLALSRNNTNDGLSLRLDQVGYLNQVYNVTSGLSLFDGDYHLVRVTFSGTTGRVYIDNELVIEKTDFTIVDGLQNRNVSITGTSQKLKGNVYKFSINDITFPLSESSGTAVFGYDTSGNTYTGTCTGFLDEGAIWSTQDSYFHGLTYGYRESSGVMIPANPYTVLACDGNALTNPPLKWNDSADYTMPDADQIRQALGWTYGTASDEYDADGTPLELTLDTLYTLGVGPRMYFGTKGMAVYDADQTTTDAKIKALLGV